MYQKSNAKDYRHTDENVNCLCHITYDQTVIAVCIRLTGGIVRLSCEALAGGSISCKNCPTVRARKRYTFHCIQGEFWTVFEINSLYCPLRRLTRKPGCPQSVGYRPLWPFVTTIKDTGSPVYHNHHLIHKLSRKLLHIIDKECIIMQKWINQKTNTRYCQKQKIVLIYSVQFYRKMQ